MPLRMFRPILPSPRHLPTDEVAADNDGNPILERRLFLLNCRLPEREVEQRYPTLWAYLKEGQTRGVAERYLSRHRTPWYAQEDRSAAPFMCTYLGRGDKRNGRPFRFILNHSQATAANVYLLLYPRMPVREALKDIPGWKRRVWKFLNDISTETLLGEGRVYGGGLHKLEPKELGNVPAAEIADLLPEARRPVRERQGELLTAVPSDFRRYSRLMRNRRSRDG